MPHNTQAYGEAVLQASQIALTEREFDTLAQRVIYQVHRLLELQVSSACYFKQDGRLLEYIAYEGPTRDKSHVEHGIPIRAGSLPDMVYQTSRMQVIEDVEAEHYQVTKGYDQFGLRSLVGIPLFLNDKLVGAMFMCAREPRRFRASEVRLLESIGNILSSALQRATDDQGAQALRRLKSVAELTGGLAHEFNNLLTVISGNLQLLRLAVGDDQDAIESIESADRATLRGSELTQKMLAFARRQPLERQTVDVGALMRDVTVAVERALQERTVQYGCPPILVQKTIASDLDQVSLDPGQFESAILNLAINACDAMPHGGTLSIRCELAHISPEFETADVPAGNYLQIELTDTGHGMRADVVEQIFEPFFTTKPMGQGTGLGLSMVYGFIKQSEGHITVDSQLDRGTSFRLFFPLSNRQVENAIAKGRAQEVIDTQQAALQSTLVLLIEDDVEVARIGRLTLNRLGYRVHVATNADQAQAAMDIMAKIEVIVSDVMLSTRETGFALVERLLKARAAKGGRLPATVFVSGFPSNWHEQTHLPVLRKPYTEITLGEAIKQALVEKQAEKHAEKQAEEQTEKPAENQPKAAG
jgi:signal transduction histidine kinase/FixJ family two-component response regulator